MREPRRTELQLLASLRGGPKAITEGPVGRCVKRGWCDFEIVDTEGKAVVLYSLTDEGCLALEARAGNEDTQAAATGRNAFASRL